jgi:hypothetical protein
MNRTSVTLAVSLALALGWILGGAFPARDAYAQAAPQQWTSSGGTAAAGNEQHSYFWTVNPTSRTIYVCYAGSDQSNPGCRRLPLP